MNTFYYIPGILEPNSASTNRCLSFVKNFSKSGVVVTVVLFGSPNNDVSLPSGENIHYTIYNRHSHGKVLRTILHFWSVMLFVAKLKKGDNILLYGSRDIMHWVVKKKQVNVYQEVTEHPDVTGYKNPLTSISTNTYLSDCKRLKHLFVISSSLRDFYTKNGVNSGNITIVNMTVDPDRFDRVIKKEGQERYIAYCGSLYNQKDGIDILIKAYSIIATKYPQIKLYIIGKTPSSHEADANENVALIKKLHLESQVILTGEMAASEMPQMLKNADALALARPNNKQTQNGFPTKLGEYLLTKNPVVVTKVSDIPMFLDDGVSAYLAEPDDVQGFANKLFSLFNDYEHAVQVGEEGYAVAMKFFNSNIEATKIIGKIFS